MKIPEGHLVCGLCREVIPKEKSTTYVAYVEWGSFSGTDHDGTCCKSCRKTKCDKYGYVKGKAYA